MPPLHVYKASAGSGKTFALTLQYLGLLFQYPGRYRNILAVTFTNKAAGEMKQRILGTLKKLAQLRDSENPDELLGLQELTGMDRSSICSRSGVLLQEILNDYSGFSVGTIDRFFQSVIRAFTREIGIQPGYNLEMDQERVLSLAVDRLFRDLEDHEILQQWLIRFAEERLQESLTWNFRNDMMELGGQLFRESFQGLFLSGELSLLQKENMERFLEDLRKIESQALQRLAGTGREAMELLRGEGLQADHFRQRGKSPASLFQKAEQGEEITFTPTQLEALEKRERWLKSDAGPALERFTDNLLIPLLNRIYQEHRVLNTLAAVRKHFYTLGIMGDLWDQVSAHTRERNLFLITDSNRFLKGIIGGNQVPFVYERTGTRYHHLMLDEFQDTSVFQYDNFKPLLDNALAQGYHNLVVGDVKQSIYRWRNSDWKILASGLESDFSHQEVHVHDLLQNYRSREEVIRFNNTVFQLAASELVRRIGEGMVSAGMGKREAEDAVQQFRAAYKETVQEVPVHRSGTGGLVKVELFEPDQQHAFPDQVLLRVPGWISEIEDSGIEPGDIAILVRTKREGAEVAAVLLEHARRSADPLKFRLISNESLLLAQNSAVILLIAALRFLIHPRDELNLALLKYRCHLAGISHPGDKVRLFDVSQPSEGFLPVGFLQQIHLLKKHPLYELVETLIGIFGLHEREEDLPYLQAFQDLVIELQRKESLGIPGFLHYWDQLGPVRGISVSDASNAIRILTIHKAKGLEFKAVIVPFCNWEITTSARKSTILWCSTRDTPMKRLPVVPVRFNKGLEHTLFSGAYFQEKVRGYMDNLNLMYVAFTRAVDVLYVGIPLDESDQFRHTGDLFRDIMPLTAAGHPTLGSLSRYRSGNTITVGSFPRQQPSEKVEETWRFGSYPVGGREELLKVRIRNDHYFVDEEGIFRTDQMYGNMMHRVFSRITTLEDLGPLLDNLQREGVLPGRERPPMERRIREMLSRKEVRNWFSHVVGRIVYSERNLFNGSGKILRPDRVMVDGELITVVDFKFGTVEKESHVIQVRNYMQHLSQMGYPQAEGYLWYVELGRTIQIGN